MSTREWHGLESQKKAEQVDWDSNNRKSIITSWDEQNISPPILKLHISKQEMNICVVPTTPLIASPQHTPNPPQPTCVKKA